MKILQRFWREESGSTLIEFGLVGSVFILSSVALFDVARGFYLQNRLDYAADRLSRIVLMDPAISQDALVYPAALEGLDPESLSVALETTQLGGVTYRNLSLSYPVSMFSPLFEDDTLNLEIERTIYAADADDDA